MYAFGYARVSHDDSFEKGNSIAAQEKKVRQFYEMTIEEQGVEWGGCFSEDAAVSAFRVPFQKRPAGSMLMKTIKKGDHVIFPNIDRVWRSNEDFVRLMADFKRKKVVVHFASLNGCAVTSNTPMGDFMVSLMVILAEMEAKLVSQRTREVFDHRWKNGKRAIPSHSPPTGTKVIRVKGEKRLVWSEDDRTLMAQIVRMRDDEQLSYEEILEEIEKYLHEKQGKVYRKSVWSLGLFGSKHRVYKWYQAEKRYRALAGIGIVDPNAMPPARTIEEMIAKGELVIE